MRQRQIARQPERLLAECFVLLSLLAQELLCLIKLIFGLLQFLANLFVGRSEFAVFRGQFLRSRSLRIATSEKIPRRFVPTCLVLTDRFREKGS